MLAAPALSGQEYPAVHATLVTLAHRACTMRLTGLAGF